MTITRTRRAWLAPAAVAGVALSVAIGGGATVLGAPAAAHAAAADPAAQQIDGLDAALLEAMKAGKAGQSAKERYRRLEPAVARAFDFATMTKFAVGPTWASIAPGQQQQLIAGLQRLTVASYVHNFDGFSGQSFQLDPKVVTRGPDKVVQTHLISPGDAPVPIAYRMRESGGAWKIIDVFYNGSISQLTTRRADFAATLASGGAPALLAHINALVDKEMK